MGLFTPKEEKLKQIELQNIIFGTEEKKLMVSQQFLDEMTNAYITKRMKNINKMQEYVAVTKSPKRFFTAYDSITADLEELIRLEKYHTFKKPIPSEYKKTIEAKIGRYTENMINRAWKDASQKNGLQENRRIPEKYAPYLDEMLEFREKYPKHVLALIDTFYKSVYDKSLFDDPSAEAAAPSAAEEAVTEEAAEELTEGIEVGEDALNMPEDDGDGFVPEEFMKI